MEDGFSPPFIGPTIFSRVRHRTAEALGPVLEGATSLADHRRSDPSTGADAEERLLRDKGWRALGAFDPRVRSRVVGLLGFGGRLVFATFASALLLDASHGMVGVTG